MLCVNMVVVQKICFLSQLYDAVRPMNSKKTLLPRLQSPPHLNQDSDDRGANNAMVETVLFDIYLCDNCEAELYSKEAYDVSILCII